MGPISGDRANTSPLSDDAETSICNELIPKRRWSCRNSEMRVCSAPSGERSTVSPTSRASPGSITASISIDLPATRGIVASVLAGMSTGPTETRSVLSPSASGTPGG